MSLYNKFEEIITLLETEIESLRKEIQERDTVIQRLKAHKNTCQKCECKLLEEKIDFLLKVWDKSNPETEAWRSFWRERQPWHPYESYEEFKKAWEDEETGETQEPSEISAESALEKAEKRWVQIRENIERVFEKEK